MGLALLQAASPKPDNDLRSEWFGAGRGAADVITGPTWNG